MKRLTSIFSLLLLLLFGGCSQQPAEIHYGGDECAHCKMMITDNRFAAQIVTETGKSIKFDAIECMAAYAGDHKSELKEAKFWVSNFDQPGTWTAIQDAVIIRSNQIKSPMGASLLALSGPEAAKQHLAEYPGEKKSWEELVR